VPRVWMAAAALHGRRPRGALASVCAWSAGGPLAFGQRNARHTGRAESRSTGSLRAEMTDDEDVQSIARDLAHRYPDMCAADFERRSFSPTHHPRTASAATRCFYLRSIRLAANAAAWSR
jgi:hypothetical protein